MAYIPGNDCDVVPNARRLLWAGSMGIFAAGSGLAIRGGILHDWGAELASHSESYSRYEPALASHDLQQIAVHACPGFSSVMAEPGHTVVPM
jgi:hypothetical protein